MPLQHVSRRVGEPPATFVSASAACVRLRQIEDPLKRLKVFRDLRFESVEIISPLGSGGWIARIEVAPRRLKSRDQ